MTRHCMMLMSLPPVEMRWLSSQRKSTLVTWLLCPLYTWLGAWEERRAGGWTRSEPLRVGRHRDPTAVPPALRPSLSAAATCAPLGGTRGDPDPTTQSLCTHRIWSGLGTDTGQRAPCTVTHSSLEGCTRPWAPRGGTKRAPGSGGKGVCAGGGGA